MQITKELRWLYQLTLAPIRGHTHQNRLESFYGRQAGDYDESRRRLLHGREELIRELPFQAGAVWIDFGGGTGANLELLGDRIHELKKIYVVDLTPSLLQVARQRIVRHGWTNVEVLQEDAAHMPLLLEEADVVTFSYSLTMMPDWYAALENAWRLLKLGGHIGVVDFYVSRKHPHPGFVRHSPWTRSFWPWWFEHDNVFLNPDHVPYLHQMFEPVHFAEKRAAMFTRLAKVPFYQFIGRK